MHKKPRRLSLLPSVAVAALLLLALVLVVHTSAHQQHSSILDAFEQTLKS